MSMDIRSFFGGVAKKTTPISPEKKSTSSSKILKTPKNSKSKKTTKKSPSTDMKRKALEVSSDEDVIQETPEEKPKSQKTKEKLSKKRRIVDSDDDVEVILEKTTNTKINLNKLKDVKPPTRKPVDVAKYYGTEPLKRIDRKPNVAVTAPDTKLLDDVKLEFEEDDDFDKSILDIQMEETKSKEKTPLKEKKSNEQSKSAQKIIPEKKSSVKLEKPEASIESPVKHEDDDYNTSIITDEDRHERKRASAIMYQQYKNRGGPPNPGSKEIPKGKPNCLAGLLFLVTGILDSMDRDEAANLIKEYGGKVTAGVTKKLNYMVVGEDAGPRKLEKADEFKIKQISEDDLLNLIREKSGMKLKMVKTSPMKVKEEAKDDVVVKQEKKSPPTVSSSPDKKRKVESNSIESGKKIKKESPVKDIKVERSPPTPIDPGMLAWVDKYKPTTINQIIGQQGAASPCGKLLNWLKKWYINHDGKKKLQRPSPWAKNDDGAFFKAALLSGPPGVGKTTTANLVSKELGFDIVEFNASDTRSKKLLKEQVSELLSTKSLYGYFHGAENGITKHHVLLMDEVDGMAGNEDRGGMQELIALIKDSSVPVICMCNDRNHQKIRSLVNYCYDLRFNKPRIEQIKGAMMSICFKENMKLGAAQLEELIQATNNDIRQTLNHLSLLNAGGAMKLPETNEKPKSAPTTKDVKFGPWDVVRKVFSFDEHKTMSFADKSNLFFHDYSLGPLFVQQNYLSVAPKVPKAEVITRVAQTADSLSLGDLVEKKIRSNNAWSLLPTQGMFSSVLPGEYMEGNFTGQINFPGWLGKNSRFNKRSRLAQEIQDHTRVKTSGSRLSVRLDYAPFLLAAILRPLKKHGADGVEESLNIIKEYRLLREDIDSLIELTSWPGKKNPMDDIDGKVKAALTRAYNKEVGPYTYSVTAAVKKKKVVSEESEMYGEDDDNQANASGDEQENDNLDNDVLIKAKKKPAAAASSTKSESNKRGAGGSGNKAGTSKGKKK